VDHFLAPAASSMSGGSAPAYALYQPHLSPDDRWVVFEATENSPNPESALFVVPALPVRMREEENQNVERLLSELDRRATAAQLHGARVDFKDAETPGLRGVRPSFHDLSSAK